MRLGAWQKIQLTEALRLLLIKVVDVTVQLPDELSLTLAVAGS